MNEFMTAVGASYLTVMFIIAAFAAYDIATDLLVAVRRLL